MKMDNDAPCRKVPSAFVRAVETWLQLVKTFDDIQHQDRWSAVDWYEELSAAAHPLEITAEPVLFSFNCSGVVWNCLGQFCVFCLWPLGIVWVSVSGAPWVFFCSPICLVGIVLIDGRRQRRLRRFIATTAMTTTITTTMLIISLPWGVPQQLFHISRGTPQRGSA